MVARFHTDNVVMAGIDVHDLEAPTPCAVAKQFSLPLTNGMTTPTVTGHGHPMVQRGFKMYAIPHIPLVPPTTPAGLAKLAWANAESSSACVFGVASVTSAGEALACAVADAWGANANCWSVGAVSAKHLSGVTASYYPLLTNPSDADIAAGLLTVLGESAYGTVSKYLLKKVFDNELVEKFLKNLVLPKARKDLEKVISDRKSPEVVDTALE